MKKLADIEPFAVGFREADISGIEPEYERNFRIACGFRKVAETMELTFDPKDWFVGPGCPVNYGSFVCYDRVLGLRLDRDQYEKEIAEYPELRGELEEMWQEFFAIDTGRLIGLERTKFDDALEENKCCWGMGGGHANPDYEMLLRIGSNGIREKIERFRKIHTDRKGFYDSLEIALSTIDTLGARYQALAKSMLETADGEDAVVLRRVITAFDNIPQNQPRDFFEACQFFWLSYSMISNDSPGLFDYTMGRYYQDHEYEDRYKCLWKLWKLFERVRAWNLCIGGCDEYGNDMSCDLTYDVLRVAREMHVNTPNITMRFHKNSPERNWIEAAKTIGTGIGMPAIYNDECVCTALEALGIPASDSHMYCMNGCNQIDIFGKSHMGLEDGEVNIAKALEFALFNGVCKYSEKKLGLETGDASGFKTFADLMDAYYKQVEYLADKVVELSNNAQRVFAENAPNPWHSLLIQGCIEKGMDYKKHGPYYGHGQILTEGLPDTADSLAAIKHYVFDTEKYTMAELLDALDKDFVGYDELHRDFSSYSKFGNDIDEVDAICSAITEHFYRYLQTKPTYRGGVFGAGCSTFNRAANYGSHLGALPNGKHKTESRLADSIGPVPGCDTNGPTAALNSVLKCNQLLAVSGNVLQMKFPKSQFNTETGIRSFISLAKTYFDEGGQTLQVNVLSAEELQDAFDHPENHKNLIVRVGGFSEYFVRLNRELQRNVLMRTEQGM